MKTTISPAYTREDLIEMIHRRDLMMSDLVDMVAKVRRECDDVVREREDYNGKHQVAVLEIERLRATISSAIESIECEDENDAWKTLKNEQQHFPEDRATTAVPSDQRGGAA